MHIIGSTKPSATAPAGVTTIEVTVETFEAEVIRRSIKTPVLLDLWANWCAPCRELGPRLERLAAAANGAFILAKVDIDANPDIGAILGVKSIPAVFLFSKGRPVDAFMGAIPEPEIRRFLEKHIRFAPAKDSSGSGAEALLGEGKIREAIAAAETDSDPIIAIRANMLAGEEKTVRDRIARLKAARPEIVSDQIEAIERILVRHDEPLGHPPHPLGERLRRNELAVVIEELLGTRGDAARRLLLDLLILLGRGPYPDEFRARLARTVFS
jgi:thioredoxin